MQKIGKLYFTVREAIFKRKVHCFINYSDADFQEWCDKKRCANLGGDSGIDLAAFSTEIEGLNRPTEWIIVLKNFDWTIGDQNSLIHEIVHTIIKIWAINNMRVNLDTQEFFAHEVGELYGEIAAQIRKLSVKKKKGNG
jgi:hypothetical protein